MSRQRAEREEDDGSRSPSSSVTTTFTPQHRISVSVQPTEGYFVSDAGGREDREVPFVSGVR